ncbi:MAG: KpsF/GutQ family sugar-phosphate isomerase [Bdellovibrionales bacterium]|nr:KpsF/GutQ family sugar-phosphate isomerase [Bdellovibrionales bacterium]
MNYLEEAKKVLDLESKAILEIKSKLDGNFEKAVNVIVDCSGKVIVTGIGKSGYIARKLASTLSSTGTPSLYLHPAESSHGDLGVISPNDCVVIISNGGDSPELKDILGFISRKNIPLISMTGNRGSELAKASPVVLDIGVSEEACPLGLAPTSSSTASLALSDALAMVVLSKKGFKKEDFAEFHPGGSLGRRLLTRVRDVMHGQGALPLVSESAVLKEILPIMTAKEVRGVAGVVNDKQELVGIITDGDIRRHLNQNESPLQTAAKDMMSRSPKTILSDEMAEKALFVMEQFSIQMLFVMDEKQGKKPVGLLHLQDLLKAKIR